MSFLVRALSSNGLTFGRARTWLDLGHPRLLTIDQIRLLAWVCGVSADWLAQRLVVQRAHEGSAALWLRGHAVRPSMLARTRWAQICPACLHADGFCRAAWDLACVSFCGRHGTLLLERCARCGRRIRIERSVIDVCQCGRLLVASIEPERASNAQMLAWGAWVEARLLDDGAAIIDTPSELPRWFTPLSIDGAYRIVWAFGIIADQLRPLVSISARIMPVAAMADVLERGLGRLQQFENSSARTEPQVREVHLPGLSRLARLGINVADRLAARRLIDHLQRGRGAGLPADGRGARPLGQLELFAGGPL